MWGLNASLTHAQIIPDNTLGAENSIVNQIDATLSEIEGGAIRGGNLFHSFFDFNIADGAAAYFANPDGIVNIISRVTGNNISNILGTLGVLGDANLFFINPNGIFFGPNAQIDIAGSFLASTASGVILPGGVEYSATNPQAPPLLTVTAQAPIGLRFEGIARTITNEGELYTFGQTLALVGGDVSIQGAGGLIAEEGRIEIGSVTGSGIVGIRQEPTIPGFALNYEGVNNFGNITLSEDAFIDTTGERGGAIQIQGGEVTLRDFGFIGSTTFGSQAGETLVINASDSIILSGDAGILTTSQGEGKAGDISLNTATFTLEDGAFTASDALADGAGGNLSVSASDSIILSGIGLSTTTNFEDTGATGNAGNITIETGELSVIDGSAISSSSAGIGQAGDIHINVAGRVELSGGIEIETDEGLEFFPSGIFNETQAEGSAGDIFINTGTLNLQDSTFIASDVFANGAGGNISVFASDSINLSGLALLTTTTNAFDTGATGAAGNIVVETAELNIIDESGITSLSFGSGQAGDIQIKASQLVQLSGIAGAMFPSGVLNQAYAEGNAGDINLETQRLIISDGAIIDAATFGSGRAGDVTIKASESIQLRGGELLTGIFAQTANAEFATGNAGNMVIETQQLEILDGAQISVASRNGSQGGDLTVRASESIVISGTSPDATLTSGQSGLFVSAEPAGTGIFGGEVSPGGNSGDLSVTTGQLTVEKGAKLSADTFGPGTAGELTINVDRLLVSEGGLIRAGSLVEEGSLTFERGTGGTLIINASESVEIVGTGTVGEIPVASTLFTAAEGTGDAGNLQISTPQLIIRDGGLVTASTSGEANAGDLLVKDTNLVSIDNATLSTAVNEGATGQGGQIQLQTNQLILTNNARILASTAGTGSAGSITVPNANRIELNNSTISTEIESTGIATQPSNITLNTQQLELNNNAQITASTAGEGDTGVININSPQKIELNNNSEISSAVEEGAKGNSREITLNTSNLTLTNESEISASTAGNGSAGSITVPNANRIELDNSTISTEIERTGIASQPSNITLNTQQLELNNNAQITASTAGEGNTGVININSPQKIELNNNSEISSAVEEGATGDSREITLNTPNLTLTGNSQVRASTAGTGSAGSITVPNANRIELDNSTISTEIERTGIASQPSNITLNTQQLELNNNAQITASTAGEGDAGTLDIDAKESINLNNNSTLASSANEGATGDGGDINLKTEKLTLDNNSRITASSEGQPQADAGSINIQTQDIDLDNNSQIAATTSAGEGGSISIQTLTFQANNGSQIRTTTSGDEDAGDINIFAPESIILSGENTGFFANTTPESTGDGGNILVDPVTFIIEDGAIIAVDSLGTGDGGDITLFADNLTLDRGTVSAQTTSGTGGNITIVVNDILELRDNAQISTTAGNQNTGGDGGNILIFSDFIFAIPSENSDITANAFTGDGGNITINARGIFGIEPRERLSPLSDITASSQFGASGVISINAQSADPIEALDTLEQNPVETQIAQGCQAVRRGTVGFFDAGRGGIPVTPEDLLRSETIITPWVPLMEELDQDTLLFFLEEIPDNLIFVNKIEKICSNY
ncbi:Filamentous haemagglutinin-like protein [Crocosphaera chwakensis CCY0110]|uniref:Filamentous haemagglutinin-like protein n=1 Tax=Crocosphaera chwakensis CCY0110 TaxID=391612 RepID=A3IXK2_9CHRO|nr:Filamentous haemagglutinin-like protein [Crocosphaera chwakensis CCY0110]